ncbi:type 1 periplasmic binding fold superfamily protein [Croceivirga thetidis]|uniref:Type 1 periplasmic binding fold superfamily protein n=1 Tax=Croceivirga thetidis TaxID=2721623 RepID=A0ABX1GT65_9FLAO|nr:type 1 periplasmic binding fold superfamily protein [Croceivirga thetidis]NKI32196.1 type 1 periplasmic binding fold superfamily protein [Croceivirga thetidis]
MKTLKFLSIFFMAGLLFVACSDDDSNPTPVDEEEVITTMTITLTPVGGGDTITFQTQDLDGDGPGAPNVTVSGNLAGNTTYNGSIVLLNETESPAENVTTEIEEENDEHQFIFEIGGSVASAAATDQDGNGNPVGLSFALVTNTAGAGTLTVTLRHKPTKPNDGTLAGAGGETDIAATFNFNITL